MSELVNKLMMLRLLIWILVAYDYLELSPDAVKIYSPPCAVVARMPV